MTATLPVAPSSVHSGVPPFGAAVGHEVATAPGAGWAGNWLSTEYRSAGSALDVLADDASGSESEPHAARLVTSAAAMPANATVEDKRVEFTVVTLQT
jgi:hypothetical protein